VATLPKSQFVTLLQREFREYKNSLFWTPIVTATVLAILMLGSVVLANRISVVGDTILDAMMRKGADNLSISITIFENGEEEITIVEVIEPSAVPAPPVPAARYQLLTGDQAA